jgi:hypothetical protein
VVRPAWRASAIWTILPLHNLRKRVGQISTIPTTHCLGRQVNASTPHLCQMAGLLILRCLPVAKERMEDRSAWLVSAIWRILPLHNLRKRVGQMFTIPTTLFPGQKENASIHFLCQVVDLYSHRSWPAAREHMLDKLAMHASKPFPTHQHQCLPN